MGYALAIELKNAGFPQKGVWGISHQAGTGILLRHSTLTQLPEVYAPTLEELIEACGEKLGDLTQGGSLGWKTNMENVGDYPQTEGSTPTEAVARLWLVLNKKV